MTLNISLKPQDENNPFESRILGFLDLNNGNGSLSIELQNVEYEDSGNFTFEFTSTIRDPLTAIGDKVDIALDVQGGPSKCGDQDLPKNFTCSKGDEISGSVTLCGKPRPILSWMIGDQSINDIVDSTKADQHQYTYSFKHIVTSDICGESVSYRAKGFQNNEVTGSALLQLDNYDISNIIFIQDDPCPILTWNADDHGLCEVDLFLSFPQNDNTTKIAKVPVAQKSFQNCNITTNATNVSYKTIVYLLIDGKRIQTSSSNITLANVGLMTTTTTTTTTPPTTITITTGLSTTAKPTTRPNEMETSEKDTWSAISFIGGYFGGIATVLLVGFIILIVYRYSKQRNKDVNQDLSLTTVNPNQNAADITVS
uniref:Uncharacterized protein n=1 Tax=Clytia hemisphaerica TaxID=252671 RepID=A0A7M5V3N4_9CNID